METQTATVPDPKEDLMTGLRGLTDFSEFKRGSDDPPQTTASQQAEEKRGVPPADKQTTDQEKVDKKPSTDVQSAASALSDEEKARAEAEVEKQKSTQPKPTTQRKEPESQRRIRELAAENKRLKEEAETAKNGGAKAQPAKQEIPQLIPSPTKPAYTREQLKQALALYRTSGNQEMIEAITEEIEKVRDYEIAMASWESRNARAWEQQQGHRVWYQQQAVQKFPDLAKPDSDLSGATANMREYVSKNFPQTLDKPLAEYFLPVLADWALRSARAVAAEEKNKQLEKELDDLKKGIQPQDQKGTTQTGGAQPGDDLKELRSTIMDALAARNPKRS